MDELMQKRIDQQPLDKAQRRSTFKRPVGAFAAALIDQCGACGVIATAVLPSARNTAALW